MYFEADHELFAPNSTIFVCKLLKINNFEQMNASVKHKYFKYKLSSSNL